MNTQTKPPQSASAATSNRPLNIGKSMDDDASRLDGKAKVTGTAKYARDMYLGNQLFVGFVRCPFGAAKLKSTDEAAAKAVPGVVEIKMKGDTGKYHGHDVGYLVAENKTALRRGLKALNAQWERESVKTQITDSAEDPPELKDAAKELLAKADHTLEAVYSTPVQTHSALETHGMVIDHKGDSAIVYASTQGTFSVRDDAFVEALELPQSKFEVRCEYVGGGFGAKFGSDKQGIVAAEVAAKYKRPVSVFVDRDEEHLDTGNRPASRTAVKIGFMKDGTIVGGQIHTWGGTGAAARGGGVSIPSDRYKLGEIQKSHKDIGFNGGGPRAMRAPGSPQGAFAEELMLDEIATKLDMDPLALRTKLDKSEDRREMLKMGAELIGWNRRLKTGTQTGSIRRGYGIGSTSWPKIPAEASADVVIHRDGSVEARTGTQDIGTGQRTIMGVLTAVNLGVPLKVVDVRIGSSSLPEGPGSGGSVTAPNSSVAMIAAAKDAREKFLKALAERTSVPVGDLDIVNGEIKSKDKVVMSWIDACQKMGADTITGHGEKGGRENLPGTGNSDGVQFVELVVDMETGLIRVNRVIAIQACGRVVCRKTAESQIIGGVIQGLSYALFENKLLDRVTGAMVNANLEMYKILGSMDMPHIQPVLWDRNQTAVRALGEPPVVPTAGATACALFNAIGSPVRHLPLTPDKVLAAIESARQGGVA